MDYESERIIQQNMRGIAKDRTVILIAHRLAAVRGCDRIVGMAEGRIVEVGAHEELIRRPGGLYAYLWGLQTQSVEARRRKRRTRVMVPGILAKRRGRDNASVPFA